MKKKPHNDEIDIHNDEIDISDLIFTFWLNKIKIIIIIFAFIIFGLLYYYSSASYLRASTNIKPISTFESQKYKLYNSLSKETAHRKTTNKKTTLEEKT